MFDSDVFSTSVQDKLMPSCHQISNAFYNLADMNMHLAGLVFGNFYSHIHLPFMGKGHCRWKGRGQIRKLFRKPQVLPTLESWINVTPESYRSFIRDYFLYRQHTHLPVRWCCSQRRFMNVDCALPLCTLTDFSYAKCTYYTITIILLP